MNDLPETVELELEVVRNKMSGVLRLTADSASSTLTFLSGVSTSAFDLSQMRPSEVRLFEREIEIHQNGIHKFELSARASRDSVSAFVEAVRDQCGSLEARAARAASKFQSTEPQPSPVNSATTPAVVTTETARADSATLSQSSSPNRTTESRPSSSRSAPNRHLVRAAGFGELIEAVALFFTGIGVLAGAIGFLWALSTDSLAGDASARASVVVYFVVLILASILWFLPIAMLAAYVRGRAEQ